MFDAMHEYRVNNKTHVERFETFSNMRFCGTKCLDCVVFFEVRHVESFDVGDSLGSIFECD
jgi:hypothetical protein